MLIKTNKIFTSLTKTAKSISFIITLITPVIITLSSPSAVANNLEKDDFLTSLSLEDLLNIEVKTVTKTVEKNSLSPAIMTIITAQDINNYGYNSVDEALSHVAGFVDNNNLAMHNFGVRGINSGVRSGSRTIKFMLDGQAIAFRSTTQNFIDQELIPMAIIKHIEVIRGPASALYGANAFLAVVNIVTKNGAELGKNKNKISLQLNAIENAGQGYLFSTIYGNNTKNLDYSFAANIGKSDRKGIKLPRKSPAYENIELKQSNTDDTQPISVYARMAYKINEFSQLKLKGHYQQLNVDNPFSDINPLQLTGTTKIALDNMFIRADLTFEFTKNITARTFIGYSQGNTLDDDKIELGAENFFLKRHFGYNGLDIGAEVFISLRDTDNLLIGFDAKQDQQKIETFSQVDRFSREQTELNPDRKETLSNVGFYLQYLRQLNKNWRAIVGLRLDDDSVINQQSSARLGVVGQLPYDIILKVLAGSSFQAPSPELLYRTAVQAGDIIGNPNLQAQQAKTIEISAAMPLNDALHFSLTYFNTKVKNLVAFTSDGSNLFANNSSDSKTDGIEFELRMLWQGIDGYLNYSWQQTKRDKPPFSLFVLEHRKTGELYPEQTVNLGINYLWKTQQIKFSWNNRWVGKRLASSSNVLFINQFYQLDPYLESTFTVSTTKLSLFTNKKTNLRLQIKDLFNSNYVNPGFGGIEFPSLGRQFLLTFEQNF